MQLQAMPKRPAGGRMGKPSSVEVNIFPVTALKKTHAFQYDVIMSPELPSDKARRAFRALEVAIKKDYPNAWFVYDGNKIAFSSAEVPEQEHQIAILKNVEFIIPESRRENRDSHDDRDRGRGRNDDRERDRGGRGGGRGRGGRGGGRGGSTRIIAPSMRLSPVQLVDPATETAPLETVAITIRPVAQLDLHQLLSYARGESQEDENISHAQTCLTVALRWVPSLLFVPVGNNFFTPESRVGISHGLEVWRGYHQSVKALMAGHLGINIDIASAVFRKGDMPVIDYLCEVLDCRDARDIERLSTVQLTKTLKNVMVVTTHRGDAIQRFKIARVSHETANTQRFVGRDSVEISVAQYFQQEYNIRLRYPDLPLIMKSNNTTAFPMELLKIKPAERFKERLNGSQTSDMIRATVQRPNDRRGAILDAVNTTLKYDQNEYLQSFGMDISREMMKVPTRTLPAPRLVLSNREEMNGDNGVWNLVNKKLVRAPELKSFGFVFFVRVNQRDAERIRDAILAAWRVAGMNITNTDVPVIIANPGIEGNIKGAMMHAFTKSTDTYGARCQMLICILEPSSKIVYETIKRVALCDGGFVTQANIKIGGATNHIDYMPFPSERIMYIGADVTHPHPGSSAPSIVALVASYDAQAVRYNTYIRAQKSRQEMIHDLKSYVQKALEDFHRATNMMPHRIVFFRDGISNGQFEECREVEVRGIKDACAEMKIECKVSFIVVLKRHHVRLFPGRDQDRSGNCVPGTVIDTVITDPTCFHFILQSHSGIQGMSRPTLYYVIHDEANMSSDDAQKMCYDLCFLSQRATRSISIVSPTYRAHLAAYYARMFLEGEDDHGSVRSGATSNTSVKLLPFRAGVEQMMYYM